VDKREINIIKIKKTAFLQRVDTLHILVNGDVFESEDFR